MSDPNLYHIVTASDGTVCVQIDDGPFVAVGESDIRLLARICNLALNEIERRKTIGMVPRWRRRKARTSATP